MISIDDYNPKNIELANLIKKYGLESETIFFIECFSPEAKEQIKELSDMGFGCQSHTCSHSHLTKISKEQIEYELEGSKLIIEKTTGKECLWLCLPRGYGNEEIYKMALEIGYKYIRGVGVFNLEKNKIGLNQTTIHAYPLRKEYNGRNWIDLFDEYLEKAKKENGNFHFWGHYREMEREGILEEFETCLRKIVDSGVFTK